MADDYNRDEQGRFAPAGGASAGKVGKGDFAIQHTPSAQDKQKQFVYKLPSGGRGGTVVAKVYTNEGMKGGRAVLKPYKDLLVRTSDLIRTDLKIGGR